VRELENVMHRAVLIETGPAITSPALDIDTTYGTEDAAPPDPATDPHAVPQPAFHAAGPADCQTVLPTAGRTIEAVEKDMILETLCRSKGNRSQAAAVLGISIRTLRNKLHEYERNGTRIPRPVIVAVN
jgi:DNA-binding NtrC family response regulator